MRTQLELPAEEGDPGIDPAETKPVLPQAEETEIEVAQVEGQDGEESATAEAAEPGTSSRVKKLNFTKPAKPAPTRRKAGAAPAQPAAPPPNPFAKAAPTGRRLKLFVFGDTGTGKTTLALQFPAPAVIDLERGTEHYADSFAYHVTKATNWDDLVEKVRWLATQPHDYQTLVIDPFTLAYDALMEKWNAIFLNRNKSSKGFKFDYYDLQAKDYRPIKAELKTFVRLLLSLDMHVIVIARAKTQYAEGEFMKAIGETFDAEKSMPYMFDTILHLNRDAAGLHLAHCVKDRTNSLNTTGAFEISYKVLSECFGAKLLTGPATRKLASDEQLATLRELFPLFGLSDEAISARLTAYGAETLEDLTADNATIIINKLEAARPQQE